MNWAGGQEDGFFLVFEIFGFVGCFFFLLLVNCMEIAFAIALELFLAGFSFLASSLHLVSCSPPLAPMPTHSNFELVGVVLFNALLV